MTRSRELAELATVYDRGNGLGFRNRIINGDMRIDQRNAGASVTTATGAYMVDRFASYNSAGQFTYQRITDAPAGFTNSLRITRSTASAGSILLIEQLVEGFNCADLMFGTASAQAVTLSFWVKSSVAGTFAGHIANKPTTRSYIFTYSINAANTWELKTVSLPGDTSGTWATDNSAGLKVLFNLGTGGGTATAGSWQAGDFIRTSGSTGIGDTLNATWQITGVQLEAGTVATPFERRDYGRELLMCQRYFQRFGAASYAGLATASMFSTTGGNFSLQYFTPMRATPTFVMTNVIVTDRTVFDADISVAASDSGPSNAWLRFTASVATPLGAGAAYLIAVKNGTTGSISATAEL